MVDYRPLPDEQRDVFFEYVSYAFSPSEGPTEYDPEEEPERAKFGSRRGLYPEGETADTDTGAESGLERPLSICRHHWFDARVRGDFHAAPGLSAVATPPENRRGGFVRELLRRSLEEYRERDARFSLLWPFEYGFYRQYGWDTANKRTVYECGPETLAFAVAERKGSFSRIEADDYGSLVPVYETHASGYALSLARDEEWWRHRVFSSWGTDPFVYAWERDGEVRGYLTYTVEEEEGGEGEGENGRDEPTMAVAELAFVDHEAYLALLSFCYNHDSQVGRVRLPAPEESRLLDLVGDPADVDCTVEPGPMVRIVDVAETLPALSYSRLERLENLEPFEAGDRPRVTLAVEDPLVEWNEGVFGLSVSRENGVDEDSGGAVTCEREPVTPSADPDATIDIGALSQLAVGYRSARELERAGRLAVSEEWATETLATLFPSTSVYLRDFF